MNHGGRCGKMMTFWSPRAILIALSQHIVAVTERLKDYVKNWTSWLTGQGGAIIRPNATRTEDADQGQDRLRVKIINENYSSCAIIA